jgi:hypothetical protein
VGQAGQGSMPWFAFTAEVRLRAPTPVPSLSGRGVYSAGAGAAGNPQRGVSFVIRRGIGPLRAIQAA